MRALRRPVPPDWRLMALWTVAVGMLNAFSVGIWLGGSTLRGQVFYMASSFLLPCVGLGATLLAIPVYRAIEFGRSDSDFAMGRLLGFILPFFGFALLGGLLSEKLALAMRFPSWAGRLHFPVSAIVAIPIVFWCEHATANQMAVKAREVASEELVDDLLVSERALAHARERRLLTLAHVLDTELLPSLTRSRAALAELCDIQLETSEAQVRLAALADELDELREEKVRKASHLLHPSILHAGLGAAILSLAERYRETLAISLVCEPPMGTTEHTLERRLDSAVRLSLYRLVEDAFERIASAGAHAAKVALVMSPERGVDLEVETDAVFQGPVGRSHDAGMVMIAARVAMLGGTLRADRQQPSEERERRLAVHVPVDRCFKVAGSKG